MDRSTPPRFKKSLLFELPDPERITLSKEAEIVYLPSNLSQAVKIEFVFKAGKIYEPALGIAQFTTQLLDKGVPGKKASDIANVLDYYGAHLESSAGFDFASVALFCLKKDVKHLLPLLLNLLSDPTFPEDELKTYQAIFIENLKVNLQKNSFLASNQIRKVLFGEHPYGLSIAEADVKKIEQNHLQHYFQKFYSPYKIFVVGDIESNDMNRILNHMFGFEFKGIPSPPPEKANAVRQIVTGPNHTQASIRLGKTTIDRNHPDIPGLTLINHILGGYFGSRLMKNVREEKGLTYGIYSSIQHLDKTSWLTISADVNAEKVDEAISEIQKEIQALSAFSSIEELELSKNHLIGSFQNDNSTIFAIADRVKNLTLNKLSRFYYEELIKGVDSLAIPDVQKLSLNYLKADSFSLVAVK